MKTPPSLGVRDVARMAGVSPMSVSRALNHPEQVSADTLAKVRRALEQTGFIGNRLASGLASRKSRLVAVMVPAIAAPVFQNIIQAISAELSAADYHVLLGQAGYDAQEHGSPLDAVIRQRPDGLVLVGVTPSALDRRKLMAAGIPTVETWDVVADPVEATIGFSHEALAVAVVAYLVDRGCRHLAFVGGAHARARRRADAFLGAVRALREAGHDLTAARCVVEAPSGVERGRAALTELLRRQPRLDGVFCSSDLLAFGVANEALLQGRAVPGDLKIVGLGDLPFSADVVPSLTSVRIHDEDIGRRAAQFIVRRAQSGLHERLRIDVGFSIVGRDSA